MSFAARHIIGIDANRTIKDELAAAVEQQRARRRVSVTDLINPRQSFFRWTRLDIKPDPQRLQAMLSGTGFHEVFGRAVSTEEFVEQFVEFQEIVGKIDVYRWRPVELKTTGSMPVNVVISRPAYLDQLGMYCTMTARPRGLLVLYKRKMFASNPELRAMDVEFADLDAIAAEMVRRRDLLRVALETGDPSRLPRCEWFQAGCDYRGCCGCEHAAAASRVVPAASVEVRENATIAAFIRAQLLLPQEAHDGFTLNDLVFPRKAALEHSAGEVEAQEPPVELRLASLQREGFKGALFQAMRFGLPGAFARVPVTLRSLRGKVSLFRGVPTLLRTSAFPRMVERQSLAEAMPHYFDRLAFECALVGSERGRLILYYEAIPEVRWMVYDVWFRDVPAIRAEADRRLRLLETGAPAAQLPPCPAWMSRFCRFAPGCGCAVVEAAA